MKTLWHISFFIQLMIFSAFWATASMCAPRDSFVKALSDKYHEEPIARAMTKRIDGQINVVEVFRSKKGETWSILVTTAEGKTCIFGAGENWTDVEPEPAGMKS